MITEQKVRLAVENPDLLRHYLEARWKEAKVLLRRGDGIKLADRLFNEVTGTSFYVPYLAWRGDDTSVKREILNNEMILDLSDSGISYDLLIYGVREPIATEIFRRYLRAFRAEANRPIVIDVGANIGYYTLQAADILGDDGTVYAFEPVPGTRELLRRNVSANEFSNRVTIEPAAVGARDGKVEMNLMPESNLAHVAHERIRTDPRPPRKRISTQCVSTDSYLDAHDIDPNDVSMIRMDIEGYEVNALEGMRDLLDCERPPVLFVEFHPVKLRKLGRFDEFLELVRRYDFEIAVAAHHNRDPAIASGDDLTCVRGYPKLFLEAKR